MSSIQQPLCDAPAGPHPFTAARCGTPAIYRTPDGHHRCTACAERDLDTTARAHNVLGLMLEARNPAFAKMTIVARKAYLRQKYVPIL